MEHVYQNEMAHEFRRQKYKRLRPYDQKRKEWRWSEIAERCRKGVSKLNSRQASKVTREHAEKMRYKTMMRKSAEPRANKTRRTKHKTKQTKSTTKEKRGNKNTEQNKKKHTPNHPQHRGPNRNKKEPNTQEQTKRPPKKPEAKTEAKEATKENKAKQTKTKPPHNRKQNKNTREQSKDPQPNQGNDAETKGQTQKTKQTNKRNKNQQINIHSRQRGRLSSAIFQDHKAEHECKQKHGDLLKNQKNDSWRRERN